MSVKSLNDRILFGLKVKQLRVQQKLSFAELSQKAGISVSYLNEIEKGKKYPKPDKIESLSQALGVSKVDLVSEVYDESIAPVAELLQSNFLNELPLDLFGIELNKVVEIIASAPARVGAFISTMLELSRNYALREENFYFGALRSYLELHNNYFEELEQKVLEFEQQFEIPASRPLNPQVLKSLLEKEFAYQIVEDGLDQHAELKNLRGLFLPKKRQLLLASRLSPSQQSFQYGKELAFSFLEMKERAYTSSLFKTQNFEEVINHSKAIYFSVALHIPLKRIASDIKAFFNLQEWNGQSFLNIMYKYDATPEMFYHRLTNILPSSFGIRQLFFLRITTEQNQTFEIDRELHLNHRHQPHSNGLDEHYCRRWIAISLLKELNEQIKAGQKPKYLVSAQWSKYIANDDQYLVLSIARAAYSSSKQALHTSNHRNVCVSIGILVNEQVKNQIKFLEDPKLISKTVHTTCERCAILDCQERAAPPVFVNRKNRLSTIEHKLEELLGDV